MPQKSKKDIQKEIDQLKKTTRNWWDVVYKKAKPIKK